MKYTFSLEDSHYITSLFAEWSKKNNDLEKVILQFEVQFHSVELKNQLLHILNQVKRYSSYIGTTLITGLINELEVVIRYMYMNKIEPSTEHIDCLLNGHMTIKNCINDMNNQLHHINLHDTTKEIQLQITKETLIRDCIEQLSVLANEIIAKANESLISNTKLNNDNLPLISIETTTKTDIFEYEIKDKFYFNMYEYLDDMNEFLSYMALNSTIGQELEPLALTVNKMKLEMEFVHTLVIENTVYLNTLKQIQDVIIHYDKLIMDVYDKSIGFSENVMSLSLEIVCNLREALESMVLEKAFIMYDSELINKITKATNDISLLSTSTQTNSVSVIEKDNKTNEIINRPLTSQSIRVSQEKLDKMMNMISELLITKNAFIHMSDRINAESNVSHLSKEVRQIGSMVNRISDELQKAIMSMRMVEVSTLFQKMPRIIRDVSQSSGKKMELIMKGETTEIDKTIIEQISDPIVHLIRNAADHGIESRNVRIDKGKHETGVITLRAYNKDKHVCIEIEDDGKGIDVNLLKQKAINKGFITEEYAEKIPHHQLIQLIFLPGFSTAEQVTELSGRGVGMDVVKSNIEHINGNITIHSEVDKGTKIMIYLPLTLAVSRGLTIKVKSETYIIPIDYVVETVKFNVNDIHEFNNKKFVYLRGEVIGIDWLSSIFLLGEPDLNIEEVNTVILTNGQEKFGLIVDRLLNEQEFVIKTLTGHLASIPGISGSTLLGSGQVVLIINPLDMIDLAKA